MYVCIQIYICVCVWTVIKFQNNYYVQLFLINLSWIRSVMFFTVSSKDEPLSSYYCIIPGKNILPNRAHHSIICIQAVRTSKHQVPITGTFSYINYLNLNEKSV